MATVRTVLLANPQVGTVKLVGEDYRGGVTLPVSRFIERFSSTEVWNSEVITYFVDKDGILEIWLSIDWIYH